MKILALVIFSFSLLLGLAIYFTKNYQYEDYKFKARSQEVKTYNINVNLADWYELSNLPGIGEALAKRIVEDRETKGRFDSIEDLRRVKGIGAKKFAEIKPYLTMDVTI